MSTLDIGSTFITTVMKNSKLGVVGNDKRGRHEPSTKTSEDDLEYVASHIRSFPTMMPHYCRHDSTKAYLESGLNVRKLYDLYVEKCAGDNRQPLKLNRYRHIFNTHFNLSFHKPKKDSCLYCDRFMQGSADEETYREHIRQKDRARQEKAKDKAACQEDCSQIACTFDLQQVLSTPNTTTSTIFYKRKLSTYNLSVYSLGTKSGTCILWDETEGKRGANEIGSCILLYLQSLPISITKVILYSDNCGGQNKNRYFSAALIHALHEIDHIQIIDHKYLQTGHTHMEVDSIHAAIECAKRSVSVYVPRDWETVCRCARKRNPYTVLYLSYTNFLNFKETSATMPHLNGIPYTKIVWIRYAKVPAEDGTKVQVMYKNDFDGAFTLAAPKRTRQLKTLCLNHQHYIPADLPYLCKRRAILCSSVLLFPFRRCSIHSTPTCHLEILLIDFLYLMQMKVVKMKIK